MKNKQNISAVKFKDLKVFLQLCGEKKVVEDGGRLMMIPEIQNKSPVLTKDRSLVNTGLHVKFTFKSL